MTRKVGHFDFIIAAQPRSGSHLLQTLLNDHPEITCLGEYTPSLNINVERARLLGCIVHHIPYFNFFAGNSTTAKAIYLHRKTRDCARSQLRQNFHPVDYHFLKSEDVPQPRQPSKPLIEQRMRLLRDRRIAYLTKLRELDIPIFWTTYERLTEGQDVRSVENSESNRILGFLGVECRRLHTPFVKGVSRYDAPQKL